MANTSKDNFPKNIGIIMDGNGRWALKNSFKISEGHKKGVEVVREIVEESVKLNIESLNLYAFSSENWQRPKAEINAIKKLVIDAINAQVPELKEKKVQIELDGGILSVDWREDGVWMTGPTMQVFTGSFSKEFLKSL